MDKNKRDGIIGTIIFHTGLLLLILFAAFRTPLPLPEESGMEVNLGYSDMGLGDLQEDINQEMQQETSQPPSSDDEIQNYVDDESVKIVEKSNKNKPKENKQPVEKKVKEEKPKVNPNAMYTKNTTKSNNQGIAGGSGDQGRPDGSLNSNNYEGLGGSGNNPNGNGVGFKLSGRNSKSLPVPKYESNDQGKVVVEIVVDKSGKVIKATAGVRGSTIVEKGLLKQCENAAMKSVFSANENATEQQIGTITYNFIKMN